MAPACCAVRPALTPRIAASSDRVASGSNPSSMAKQQARHQPPGLSPDRARTLDQPLGRRDRIRRGWAGGGDFRAATAGHNASELAAPLGGPRLDLAPGDISHAGHPVQPDRIDGDEVSDGLDAEGLQRRQRAGGQAGLCEPRRWLGPGGAVVGIFWQGLRHRGEHSLPSRQHVCGGVIPLGRAACQGLAQEPGPAWPKSAGLRITIPVLASPGQDPESARIAI
jgi:hypothetical protein